MTSVLKIVAIIVVVFAIGGLIGWLSSRSPKATSSPAAVSEKASAETTTNPTGHIMAVSSHATAGAQVEETADSTDASSNNAAVSWDEKLDGILGSDADETDKARQMIKMFPSLPPEGQVEIAGHIVNLTPDEDFSKVGDFLLDSHLPEQALDTFLTDALNRGNTIKMPLILKIAQMPNHPKAAEARDLLELYLEEDYGDDWTKWQEATDSYLKDNPE